tara:strand:+ start:6952 stop:8424 length:1473 start_codon:yes stop_codon:yes gene_type:complete
MAKGILSDNRFGEKEIPIDFREEFNKGNKADSVGSKMLKVLSSPVDFIAKLGRLQFDASKDANDRLKEKISTSYDNRLDLVKKSLPVIKGTKSIDELKKELKELYDDEMIKDDRQYRALINNYFYHFKRKHLPNFQKEIAETGKMPKDVVKYFDDYEAFRNSNKYRNPYAAKYTRPDLTLPSSRDKKQDGGLLNPEKADLDNDGELSSYEEARGKAIEENMRDKKAIGGLGGLFGSVIQKIRTNPQARQKLGMPELETDEYGQLKPLPPARISAQVGGMMMDDQMTDMMETEETPDMDNQMADMMPEEKTTEQKAIEEAQAPDEKMEENYVDFLIDEALSDDEEEMLMKELQANPQLSMLFDKVMEVAMEFSGSGPVEGPGSEVSDSIPARLSDGEFVFTAKAVDVLGVDNLMSLMKQAEAQADGRQTAQDGGLMEEEDTVMPVEQQPVRQDIRVTKETVGSQAAMQEEDDLVGDEIKKSMLSNRPYVRS